MRAKTLVGLGCAKPDRDRTRGLEIVGHFRLQPKAGLQESCQALGRIALNVTGSRTDFDDNRARDPEVIAASNEFLRRGHQLCTRRSGRSK
jgi:hypothetical protein